MKIGRIVILFVLAVGTASMVLLAGTPRGAELGPPDGVVREGVIDALKDAREVPVIISLQQPTVDEPSAGDIRENASQRQASVLADLRTRRASCTVLG